MPVTLTDGAAGAAADAIGRIPRTRLVDKAAEVLRGAILGGRLAPGSRIRQLALAGQLGISRTPLREALARLEVEGLVRLLPAGGVEVARFDPQAAIELYDVREVLDGLAARRAAERGDRAAAEGLRRHQWAMRACLDRKDAHEWFTHHVAFHEGIFLASGNARLVGMLSVVRQAAQRFHGLLLTTPNRLAVAFEEHEAILRAIEGRDPERAEALARLHIRNAKSVVAARMAAEIQAHES
jgi:DNA-binding GntR family transcriptional regulator